MPGSSGNTLESFEISGEPRILFFVKMSSQRKANKRIFFMQDLGKCTQFLRIYLKDLKEAFQPNKNSIKSMISRGEGRDL